VEYLGARIEVPYTRAIVSYWREAVKDVETGVWTVEIESPPGAGDYLLVWRTGDPEPPEYEVFFPLHVVAASDVSDSSFPAVDLDAIRPTVEDIAALENTRLVTAGGGEAIVFDENSRPTADQVEALIGQATNLVAAEFPPRFPVTHYGSIQHAVALYTAVLIEGSYFREQADEGSAELWRTLYNTAVLNAKRQIDSDLKQWRLIRRIEDPVNVIG
jgi:hypothetical protein